MRNLRWTDIPWNAIRVILTVVVIAIAGLTFSWWWNPLVSGVTTIIASTRAPGGEEHDDHGEGDSHAGHTHAAAPTSNQALALTPQAKANLGLTKEFLAPITLEPYQRMLTVPAVVTPRPGRTQLQVSTPLTGVVTHVHATTGESVLPGSLLFEMRLTHEDLVESQTAYLQTLGELEVENREIERLQFVVQNGAVSGKTLLEKQYAKAKLESLLSAQQEALRLHGLSDRQVRDIAEKRQLLRDLRILAPDIDEHGADEELRLSRKQIEQVSYNQPASRDEQGSRESTPLIVERLDVHKGQSVMAGAQLCQLADYSQLYLEGQAFEQDAAQIATAAREGRLATAILTNETGETRIENLRFAFIGNSVDAMTRTFSFYVDLPNQILHQESNSQGQTFISWQFRPGQRMQVQIPVETWTDQIVLPTEAVVRDGPDWYVFQQSGANFLRVPVHVIYHDGRNVVINNDGAIYVGNVIARRGAYQMQMAIKNQSGGAVDPHAGHNHG